MGVLAVDAVMVRGAVVEIILARRTEAQQDGRGELRVCRADNFCAIP